MSYYVSLRNSNFTIPAEKADLALGAVFALVDKDESREFMHTGADGKRHFLWFPDDWTQTYTSLAHVFQQLGFETSGPDDGDFHIWMFDSKWADIIEYFLNAVAPFVDSGDYLEFHGEDGNMWRFAFLDGKLNSYEAHIEWHISGCDGGNLCECP
jgi:hypothetical protein